MRHSAPWRSNTTAARTQLARAHEDKCRELQSNGRDALSELLSRRHWRPLVRKVVGRSTPLNDLDEFEFKRRLKSAHNVHHFPAKRRATGSPGLCCSRRRYNATARASDTRRTRKSALTSKSRPVFFRGFTFQTLSQSARACGVARPIAGPIPFWPTLDCDTPSTDCQGPTTPDH
jgi:hypothetical protein